MDTPLTLKIIQNENRLKKLFNSTSKRNRYNTTDYKLYSTDKVSCDENLNSTKNCNVEESLINNNVYDENIIKQMSSQKTMEIEKENSKEKIKVNKSRNSKINSKNKENKRNKTSKMNLSINPFLNRIKNNPINSFHNYSSVKTPLNRNITSVKLLNVERMIQRFRENEEKINNWIQKERNKKEMEENKRCQNSPKINNRSKRINLKIKDSFLLRLQKSENEKQHKAEILKESLKNKKLEEERKSKGMKGKSRTNKTNLSTGKKISETLNKYHALDEKRKGNINLKRKIQFSNMNKLNFIQKINKRSTSMAELIRKNYSKKNLFDRLAKIGKYSVEKKNI